MPAKALNVLDVPGSQAALLAGDARRVASVQSQLHPPQVLYLSKTPGLADQDQAERGPDQKTNIVNLIFVSESNFWG